MCCGWASASQPATGRVRRERADDEPSGGEPAAAKERRDVVDPRAEIRDDPGSLVHLVGTGRERGGPLRLIGPRGDDKDPGAFGEGPCPTDQVGGGDRVDRKVADDRVVGFAG